MDRFESAYYDLISEKLYSAIIGDTVDGLGYRNQIVEGAIRPLYDGARIVGRAATMLTVDVHSMPSEPLKLELDLLDGLKQGEVVVCACNGSTRAAIWGELLSTCAVARGARGAVIDGMTRDSWGTNAMQFPVFAKGYSPATSIGRMEIVAIRVPVRVGGVLIEDGDLIFADTDGIVVVPQAIEEQAIAKAIENVSGENRVRDALASGASIRAVFKEFGIL